MSRIELWAEMATEIKCHDVRGIAGGCATLPRAGQRLTLHTLDEAAIAGQLAGPAWDPCVRPVFGGTPAHAIRIDRDLADALLTVSPDGAGAVPAPDQARVVLRVADIVSAIVSEE